MLVMKKSLLIFTLFVFQFSQIGVCQRHGMGGDPEDRMEKTEAARVAYITTRLNLNSQQAQQFWPLFNEMEAAKKKIRKLIRQLVIENKTPESSDEQVKEDLKKFFSLRQEQLDVEKSYSEKFMKVLSPKQVVDLFRSEKEFTKMLIKRIRGKGKDSPEGD